MSLVAYASSDGSGSESEEDRPIKGQDTGHHSTNGPKKPALGNEFAPRKNLGQFEEMEDDIDIIDDDWEGGEASSSVAKKSIFSFLPPPTKETTSYILEEEETVFTTKTLPVKEELPSSTSKESEDVAANDQGTRKRTAKLVLPKPKASGKDASKQTMKITIPNLPDVSLFRPVF